MTFFTKNRKSNPEIPIETQKMQDSLRNLNKKKMLKKLSYLVSIYTKELMDYGKNSMILNQRIVK